MSDPNEIVTVVLTTLGATKILAAPAEAVADALKDRIRSRLERTLKKAERKRPGVSPAAPDRVAVKVLSEAAFTDDEVVLEYLAGVLAASHKDSDEGAAVVALIGRLSALQLRLHFLIYREVRRVWPLPDLNLYIGDEARRGTIKFVGSEVGQALQTASVNAIGSGLAVLFREGLIGSEYELQWEDETKWWMQAEPTGLGAELFAWGTGSATTTAFAFFDQRSDDISAFDSVGETPGTELLVRPKDLPPGARLTITRSESGPGYIRTG
jgi:hypothetical protein